MQTLLDTVRGQYPEVDPGLLDRHINRLPISYFERYSPAEIARHLRLLAELSAEQPVRVDVRLIASQTFEVLVVGQDHAGTLACITAALAAYGFALEDVQVSSYLDTGADVVGAAELRYFVIVLRMV